MEYFNYSFLAKQNSRVLVNTQNQLKPTETYDISSLHLTTFKYNTSINTSSEKVDGK